MLVVPPAATVSGPFKSPEAQVRNPLLLTVKGRPTVPLVQFIVPRTRSGWPSKVALARLRLLIVVVSSIRVTLTPREIVAVSAGPGIPEGDQLSGSSHSPSVGPIQT